MLMNPIIQTGALNFASFHERLVMILCVALTGSRRVSLNHMIYKGHIEYLWYEATVQCNAHLEWSSRVRGK